MNQYPGLAPTSFNCRSSQSACVALSMLGFFLFPMAGCKHDEAAPPTVVEVQAATVNRQSISEEITADAVLAPLAQAAIVPRIAAPVRKFYVQRGARVKAGELLAQLENKDLTAATVDAKGGYTQAQAAYQIATKSSVPEDYQKAELDRKQAKASLDLAQRIFDDRNRLFTQGAIPGRDLDTARLSLLQARAQYDTADKHFESLQSFSRAAQLEGAAGQMQSARGKYLGAQAQLQFSEIRSPISGVVTDRQLFDGETAPAGAAVITVMDTSALLAKLHLPQAQAQRIHVGSKAQVTLPGLDRPIDGKVSLVSPALDPGSTTVEIWVSVENPGGELRAGSTARVAITAREIPDALIVPAAAILTDATGKKTVLVIHPDSTAHIVAVETGVINVGDVQILSGLSAGEKVVSTGAYSLTDGVKVKVVAAGDESASPDGKDKRSAASPGDAD